MTDLTPLNQSVSVAPGEAAEEPGEFTQFMRAAYWRHADLKAALAKEQAEHQETQRLLELAQQEIAKLTKELAELRSGKGVVVSIDGRSFTLESCTLPMERPLPGEPTAWDIDDSWLSAAMPRHDTQKLGKPLADSFILS